MSSFTFLTIISVLIFLLALTVLPVSAEYDGESVIGRYDDWDLENSPTVGMGIFPMVTIEPKNNSGSSSTATIRSSSGTWVTISPFSATLSGQETNLVVGYLSGTRTGVILTIEGKGSSDSGFSDITTIKPDENGLFVWAVPASYQDIDLFRVTAWSGGTQILSNAIRFTDEAEEPIVKPVVSPVQTVIPMVKPSVSPVQPDTLMAPGGSSGYGQSSLRISASSSTPAVGDDVVISGRLTDQDGKGISGATVSIDESGYPGATEAEPFDTTQTDSDGKFEFTIKVAYANTVGLVAHYEGDKSHSAAESNSIIFTSHA